MFWPCETRTSTCLSFATISSGLYRFLAIAVLLDVKDIPQVGPLQWGWINTPTWHANAVEVYERQLLDFIPLVAEHVAQQRPDHREYIRKAVAEGRIVPNVDSNHIKGILTQQLTNTITMLYHQDWIILKNITEVPFITSDNPSSVFPRRGINAPLVRFLPLAPDLAVLFVADRTKWREALGAPDLSQPPPGTVRRAAVSRKGAVRLIPILRLSDRLLPSRVARW